MTIEELIAEQAHCGYIVEQHKVTSSGLATLESYKHKGQTIYDVVSYPMKAGEVASEEVCIGRCFRNHKDNAINYYNSLK